MQSFFVRVLRVIATIAWVFFWILFLFVEIVLFLRVFTGEYMHRDITVNLLQADKLPPVIANSAMVKFHELNAAEATLKINMKITWWTTSLVIIGFSGMAVLALVIISHVRKILRTIKQDTPFDPGNIRRLRLISSSLFLITIINFLFSLFDYYLISVHGGDIASHYVPKINFGLTPLITAMIIFILSEIFKQGYALKTENEAFV